MKLLKAFTLSSMVAAGTVMRETEASASDIAEPADNSMEQLENMPAERQRRFWVRFLIGHLTTEITICLKFIKRQLAANAAHAVINHYVGDESDSPAEQSENMPEERQRRFWVRLFL